jgi:hypothetical protein
MCVYQVWFKSLQAFQSYVPIFIGIDERYSVFRQRFACSWRLIRFGSSRFSEFLPGRTESNMTVVELETFAEV